MNNINEYQEESFEEEFKNSAIAQAIAKDFDMLSWQKHVNDYYLYPTHRQRIGSRTFSMNSWYYIGYLLEKNPKAIYDIGCGWNIHKNYLPIIIGISPDNPEDPVTYFGDEYDFCDEVFISNRQNYFESAMSICSLCFRPFTELRKSVEEFISMIKPGGRGYIALDIHAMVNRTSDDIVENLLKSTNLDDYVRNELDNLPCKVLVYDQSGFDFNDSTDGNLRIVFEKE